MAQGLEDLAQLLVVLTQLYLGLTLKLFKTLSSWV
jgi:hypothetical protein